SRVVARCEGRDWPGAAEPIHGRSKVLDEIRIDYDVMRIAILELELDAADPKMDAELDDHAPKRHKSHIGERVQRAIAHHHGNALVAGESSALECAGGLPHTSLQLAEARRAPAEREVSVVCAQLGLRVDQLDQRLHVSVAWHQ